MARHLPLLIGSILAIALGQLLCWQTLDTWVAGYLIGFVLSFVGGFGFGWALMSMIAERAGRRRTAKMFDEFWNGR